MPRAGRICLTEGCTSRVPPTNRLGYCDEHKPKNAEPWKRADGMNYGVRLPVSVTQAILRRDPKCYDPHNWGCKNPSTDVDHVIPRWKGGRDTLDNMSGVCHPCHKRKSALEGVAARAEAKRKRNAA